MNILDEMNDLHAGVVELDVSYLEIKLVFDFFLAVKDNYSLQSNLLFFQSPVSTIAVYQS